MRQIVLILLGLALAATGAEGFIRLLVNHHPGALGRLPGGFLGHLAGYALIFLFGLTMARRNRVHADPEHDRRR